MLPQNTIPLNLFRKLLFHWILVNWIATIAGDVDSPTHAKITSANCC